MTVAACSLTLACGSAPPAPSIQPPPAEEPQDAGTMLSDDVTVRQLTANVWLHKTATLLPKWGRFTANGVIVTHPTGSLLIDTAWTPAQAERLLAWADARGTPITTAVVTHSHNDRTGGVEALVARGLPVLGLDRTQTIADQAETPGPTTTFTGSHIIDVGDRRVRLFDPGPGHAPDNIVVWIDGGDNGELIDTVLIGGCLVRSASSERLGHLADADVTAWGRAIDRVNVHFPQPLMVVPGHGRVGDEGLLTHTADLVARHLARSRPAPKQPASGPLP